MPGLRAISYRKVLDAGIVTGDRAGVGCRAAVGWS